MHQRRSLEMLLLLIALAVIGPAGLDMYLPAVAVMPQELQVTAQDVQLTLSIYMLALGAGQLLFGPLADRCGRRPVVLMSLFLFSAGSLGAAQTDTFSWLVGWRLLQGLGGCGAGLVAFTVVRDHYRAQQRAKIYNLLNAGIGIAPALAPVLGSYLLLWGGWRLTFWILLALGLIVFVISLGRLPETRPKVVARHERSVWAGYRQLIGHRIFWAYSVAGLASMSGLFVFFSLAPLLFVGQWGISAQQFAYFFASNALVMMLACMLASRLSVLLSHRVMVLLGLALAFSAGALLVLMALFEWLGPVRFIATVWLASTGFALTMGASAAGALASFGHIAGQATALMSCIRLGGAALVGSLAVAWNSTTVWPLASVLLGLSVIAAYLVLRYCTESIPE